jgi:hypothetical protein
MPWKGPSHQGDFPSLGYLVSDWVEAHCIVPDGFSKGDPFVWVDEQLVFGVHHYRLRPDIEFRPDRPLLASAFKNRRSQLVRAQKWGKNPLIASLICAEGVGPVLFAGWAVGGETWDCRDHGCGCGWVYEYEPGEPMGMAWPTPLIQITAVSEEQTDNTYAALRPMIDDGPLHEVIPKTGEQFIRLPGGGRIDVVTSSARSRLGQRVTFVPQDETGLWTAETGMVKVAETQRRGLAGMGGRAIETTNPWDPAEHSVAQRTYEATADDVYRDYRMPPANLSYSNKRERRKIHKFNYAGSPWVDIDSIEAEAAELLETDPAQAERFFGNRVQAAADAAFDIDQWEKLTNTDAVIADRSLVVIGVDGARFDDALAIIATDVISGHQWPLEVPGTDRVSIWTRPENADDDYEHPADEADAAMIAAFEKYQPWRVYCDPQWIDHLVDRWAGRWGDRVVNWYTNRPKQIAYALRNYRSAMSGGDISHDGNTTFARHIGNARRRKAVGVYDEERRPMWTVGKPPGGSLKIDAAMAGCLSWEARGDAIAAGATTKRKTKPSAYA